VGGEPLMAVSKDDSFDLSGVLPGSYNLMATLQKSRGGDSEMMGWTFTSGGAEAQNSRNAHLPVEVTDHNVEGLVLTFRTGATVEGVVRAIPESKSFNPKDVYVGTRSKDNDSTGTSARVSANGAFTLKDVLPGRHQVEAYSLPEEGYIKSVKYNDQALEDRVFEAPSGTAGGKLELLIAFDGAEVDGMVLNAAGSPIPGAYVIVYRQADKYCDCDRGATSDQHGRFHIRGLAPGEYRVLGGDPDAMGDPEFSRTHDAEATSLKVAANGHLSVTLKVAAVRQ
jgi:hypothetical protein